MVGKNRLDVLRKAVHEIGIDGFILEFGVFRGKTVRVLSKLLPNKTIYGFDSFTGLPEDWYGKYTKGTFNLKGVPPKLPKNVIPVKGMFEKTLPHFLEASPAKVAFVNFDADLYSSTKFVLETLYKRKRFVKGTILYFDEFISKNYADELMAFIEMGIPARLLSYYWLEDSYSSFAFKVL